MATPLLLRPLARYADFQGRSRRAEFFSFLVVVWLITGGLYGWLFYLVFTLFGKIKIQAAPDPAMFSQLALAGCLTFLFALALLVPTLAVQVRRLHDSNRSGWWLLLPMAASTLGQSVLYAFQAEKIMQITQSMAPAMEAAVARPDFSLLTLLQAQWPLYELTLPYTVVPSLAADLVLLIFFFWPGTRGDNRFGPNPRAR